MSLGFDFRVIWVLIFIILGIFEGVIVCVMLYFSLVKV